MQILLVFCRNYWDHVCVTFWTLWIQVKNIFINLSNALSVVQNNTDKWLLKVQRVLFSALPDQLGRFCYISLMYASLVIKEEWKSFFSPRNSSFSIFIAFQRNNQNHKLHKNNHNHQVYSNITLQYSRFTDISISIHLPLGRLMEPTTSLTSKLPIWGGIYTDQSFRKLHF